MRTTMNDKFPISLTEVFGVLGVAGIAYSVVKDWSGSASTASVAAAVVVFFGILGWAIYRVAPRRNERFKMAVSHDRSHAIKLINGAKESILVTHFTRDLPSLAYTAAMLARLQKGIPIARVVSGDIAGDAEVRTWLDQFKKHPGYTEAISPSKSLPLG